MGKIVKITGIIFVFMLSLFSIYHIVQSRSLEEKNAE